MFLKTFHTSMLKDSSRVGQTNSLLDNQPKLGFGYPQIQMDLQHLQWSSCLLICFKESPCQVYSLTSKVPSDNCSDGWKSVVLDKKSTVVNIQSNFLIFGQHPHFEVTFIIWSRVDHDSSRKLKICSKVKLSKLGVSSEKSTELWLSITFSYFIRNFSTTSHFGENSILYNFKSHKHGQKMLHFEDMGQNITSPFQSQPKVKFL